MAVAGGQPRISILSADTDPGNRVAAHAMKDDAPDSALSNLSFGRLQRALCDNGDDRFKTKFETGVTVEVVRQSMGTWRSQPAMEYSSGITTSWWWYQRLRRWTSTYWVQIWD